MSIRLRTKEPSLGLCHKCSYGSVKTLANNSNLTYCGQSNCFLKAPALECTSYEPKEAPYWELEKKAWILEMNKGKVIGFTAPWDKKRSVPYE